MQKRYAACQGFLNSAHKTEDLRARHPEISGIVMLIYMNFNVCEQFGSILHLVNEYGWLVDLQKEGRIVLGHIARSKVIKRHILSSLVFLFGKCAKHCCFA